MALDLSPTVEVCLASSLMRVRGVPAPPPLPGDQAGDPLGGMVGPHTGVCSSDAGGGWGTWQA